ncbi:hypothetical protein [Klenkia sp. PcliD-1-E]|uniref:hypothetical protein n=1 Tax=Klenkia sp. PcliD-1-E TaxID=2954492 RepID=UPI0020972EDB|nr:hypothetical protein [Klenkia sp. PcliD-1-E]MCO7218857.1 hypothetical protein [Klenkia sp. PcliD-1-E]
MTARPRLLAALGAAALPLALAAACSSPSTNGPGSDADPSPVVSEPVPVERSAELQDAGGSTIGSATLSQAATAAGTTVELDAAGLSVGEHPLTLLDSADCAAALEGSGQPVEGAELAGLVVQDDGGGQVSATVDVQLEDLLDDDGSALLVGPADTDAAGPTGSEQACAAFGG